MEYLQLLVVIFFFVCFHKFVLFYTDKSPIKVTAIYIEEKKEKINFECGNKYVYVCYYKIHLKLFINYFLFK